MQCPAIEAQYCAFGKPLQWLDWEIYISLPGSISDSLAIMTDTG